MKSLKSASVCSVREGEEGTHEFGLTRRDHVLKAEIEKATAALIGTALWSCRRTADLASFQFGQKEQAKTFRGNPVEVGEYALNVQCAWRIARENRVFVGSADLYYPSDLRIERTPPDFDWSKGPNRRDELLRLLFEDG